MASLSLWKKLSQPTGGDTITNDVIFTEVMKISKEFGEFRGDLRDLRTDFERHARKADKGQAQLFKGQAQLFKHARKAEKGQAQLFKHVKKIDKLARKIDELNKTTTRLEKNVGNLFFNSRLEWFKSSISTAQTTFHAGISFMLDQFKRKRINDNIL